MFACCFRFAYNTCLPLAQSSVTRPAIVPTLQSCVTALAESGENESFDFRIQLYKVPSPISRPSLRESRLGCLFPLWGGVGVGVVSVGAVVANAVVAGAVVVIVVVLTVLYLGCGCRRRRRFFLESGLLL